MLHSPRGAAEDALAPPLCAPLGHARCVDRAPAAPPTEVERAVSRDGKNHARDDAGAARRFGGGGLHEVAAPFTLADAAEGAREVDVEHDRRRRRIKVDIENLKMSGGPKLWPQKS